MEIRPTTIVKLFSGVPINNTYADTLYFSSLSAQSSYFASLTTVKTFTSQMYQRVNKGQFEANCKADDIYNCNYMAFQNSGFGNKWFYAFINSIEYINNNNSLVTFEIDVMQTWMFDYELKRCFIERQHSVTDEIGANILPEPVNAGEYVFDNYGELAQGFDDYALIIAICDVDDSQIYDCGTYDNVFCGAKLWAIRMDAPNLYNSVGMLLQNYVKHPESIVNMYMCPMIMMPQSIHSATVVTALDKGFTPQSVPVIAEPPKSTHTTGFGLYTPKNNKLYTYPYNYFHVDNGQGESLDVRYEFFEAQSGSYGRLVPRFIIDGCINSPIQYRITPLNYKGSDSGPTGLRSEYLGLTGFPLCSWNYDAYKAWLAQNSVPMAVGIVAGSLLAGMAIAATGGAAAPLVPVLAGAGGGMVTGAEIAAGVTIAGSAAMKAYQASIQADPCKGNINTGNVSFSKKQMKFFGGRARITEDYARMIDGFFTMYGYTYNAVGIPNISSRPHWNYIKTAGAKIIGECPADDIVKICSIYDRGITFWKNASEVGNYNLDNSPT